MQTTTDPALQRFLVAADDYLVFLPHPGPESL
jgi:hypothetical protein